MTMTWIWTDGVQLNMNNYACFFFYNAILFTSSPVVKIVTSPLDFLVLQKTSNVCD